MNKTTAYLGRQPILDGKQQIAAYELLFREGGEHNFASESSSRATAQVLLNTVAGMGIRQVLGDKLGFINFGREMLEDEIVFLLPREQVVLEILEDVEPDADLVKRCRDLKAAGYRFALDDFIYSPKLEPLLAVADFIKLDLTLLEPRALEEHARMARARNFRLIAEKVEDCEQFAFSRALGAELFQGYFFARPVILQQTSISAQRLPVLQLLNELFGDADIGRMERIISRDLGLSYKLLRFINSASQGRIQKTDSIRDAIVGLGQQQLYRLLTLLLFAGEGDATASPLVSTALQRGRLLEAIGQRCCPARSSDLFLLGSFSLLETLLEMPLSRILEAMHLPKPLEEALLSRSGPLAPYLDVAEALERYDWERVDQVAASLGLSEQVINEAQLKAMQPGELFTGS